MTPADIADLEPLVAGRNVGRREYERFLGLEGAHGLVFEAEGRLLAAVTAIRYFEHGFVGPVLAAPGAEGAGVQVALLERAVEGLRRSGVPYVEAEATPGDAPLLEGLGFARVRGTRIVEREPVPAGSPSTSSDGTRAMSAGDLLDVGALDAQVAGYGRKEFLAVLRAEHPEGARVVERAGEVAGYAMLRRSRRGFHLGPLVTSQDDLSLAETLLLGALAQTAARPVVALLPDGSGLAPALERAGFAPVGDLVRMRAGERLSEASPATEWLVGSRVTG